MHFIFGLRINKQQQPQRRVRGRTRLALGRAGAMPARRPTPGAAWGGYRSPPVRFSQILSRRLRAFAVEAAAGGVKHLPCRAVCVTVCATAHVDPIRIEHRPAALRPLLLLSNCRVVSKSKETRDRVPQKCQNFLTRRGKSVKYDVGYVRYIAMAPKTRNRGVATRHWGLVWGRKKGRSNG